MFDLFTPDSFYNWGDHFLFLWLITVHVCLFTDLSPLQKRPMCSLNYLLASLLAAGVPAVVTVLVHFGTPYREFATVVGLALALSVALALSIQRVLDIHVDF